MKRVVLFLFITLVINNLVAQNITVSTNECLEMLNTIWILSNGSDDAASKSMVEKQFSKFKSHNVVKKMYIRNYPFSISFLYIYHHRLKICIAYAL